MECDGRLYPFGDDVIDTWAFLLQLSFTWSHIKMLDLYVWF